MTQTDKLNRVNEVIQLARELFIHQGDLTADQSLYLAEIFIDSASKYREEKRKAIITGKGGII